MKFLTDWRFILIYVGIAAGLAGLIFWGGSISPIDRHMQGKGGGFTSIFRGGGGNFSRAPKDGFELIGSTAGTQFAYVKPEHAGSKSALRAIGEAVCQQAKSPSYCEVYFWTKKADIKVEIPVSRGGSLVAYYENKDGQVKLKMLQ